jgi:hypothetical protein
MYRLIAWRVYSWSLQFCVLKRDGEKVDSEMAELLRMFLYLGIER